MALALVEAISASQPARPNKNRIVIATDASSSMMRILMFFLTNIPNYACWAIQNVPTAKNINLVYIRCQEWKCRCSLNGVNNREILKTVGKNIREARLKAGLTQECLAELAGVHVQTIGAIEHGGFPFAVTTFARISQFLETSPNRLLDGLEPPDSARTARIKKALIRKRVPRRTRGD